LDAGESTLRVWNVIRTALLETYAALTPQALESLTSEERQKVYKLLKLKVVMHLDRTIEVGGTFMGNLNVCTLEAISS
jgi:gamma-glutamyl phosphate reductase